MTPEVECDMILFYFLVAFFLLRSKSSHNLKLLLFNTYLLSICVDICEFYSKVQFSGAEYFALSMEIKNVYYKKTNFHKKNPSNCAEARGCPGVLTIIKFSLFFWCLLH